MVEVISKEVAPEFFGYEFDWFEVEALNSLASFIFLYFHGLVLTCGIAVWTFAPAYVD